MSMNLTDIFPGFENTERESQIIFRQVLSSFSRPGLPFEINPRVKSYEADPGKVGTSLLLALMDTGSSLHLPGVDHDSALRNFLKFHTGCTFLNSPEQADYIWVQQSAHLPALQKCALGSAEFPEASTTLIIDVEGFKIDANSNRYNPWFGPGINGELHLEVLGLKEGFWIERETIRPLFPCGVDVIFCSPTHIVSLPRSTRIGEEACM